ncbi:hexapeptide transferase family protein [Carboxydothermus hydrogenoformans Z-2901]|uniref:Hexapeptide transferase family protein n=1 Tax=Carboxydothermus hydrogenoformans (strain ATCC BAA-161 / DSM 6008 / Z-2901) TaxID=246194 RepID=Q3ACL6_CARHZ|nr:hexapeptide transferase family protein [Carboxydothermus hydrogenoformans Z-2901]
MYPNPFGNYPVIGRNTYVHPSAQIIGRVEIGENCFIGPNAVIRADEPEKGKVSPIIIGNNVNVQDGVIIHALAGTEVRIGNNVSLAHGAIIHGPVVIKENCFVGFGALVFKAVLNEWVFVGHRAVVQEREIEREKFVPEGVILTTEYSLPVLSSEQKEFIKKVCRINLILTKQYLLSDK